MCVWGGGVVRPLNNPLYSLRANKNANAHGKGDAIVRRGSTRTNADRGTEAFFSFFLYLLLLFSVAVFEVMGQIR